MYETWNWLNFHSQVYEDEVWTPGKREVEEMLHPLTFNIIMGTWSENKKHAFNLRVSVYH